jgi:hypothetical protein
MQNTTAHVLPRDKENHVAIQMQKHGGTATRDNEIHVALHVEK